MRHAQNRQGAGGWSWNGPASQVVYDTKNTARLIPGQTLYSFRAKLWALRDTESGERRDFTGLFAGVLVIYGRIAQGGMSL